MQINTDDAAATGLLTDLKALLARAGAWFSKDLLLLGESGSFRFEASRRWSDRRSVLRIPVTTMPFLCDARTRVAGGEFIIDERPEGDGVAAECLTLLVELYNRSGKLRQWRADCPWLAPAPESALVDRLLDARGDSAKGRHYRRLRDEGRMDELLHDSFIGSRAFNVAPRFQEAIGRSADPASGAVLLPMIDYFNHDMRAEGFSIQAEPAPPSMRIFATPRADTAELYVRYNFYDPVDTYLYYGFVDAGAPHLTSIATELSVAGRTLGVTTTGERRQGKLHPQVKDLRPFLPVVRPAENGLTVSRLIFPGPQAPRALRRVLSLLLTRLEIPRAEIPAQVEYLENQLVERNLAFWEGLAAEAVCLAEQHPLRGLCAQAIAHIYGYLNYPALAGKTP